MGDLRERMRKDMNLRGLAATTQEAYVRVLVQATRHFGKSPADITVEEWRGYFSYLVEDRRLSGSSIAQVLSALVFLYRFTLKRDVPELGVVKPRKSRRRPCVLGSKDVKRILSCVHHPVYRDLFTLLYGCGLRLSEGIKLPVQDVDLERSMLKVTEGKGDKDRYVPIPSKLKPMLQRRLKGVRADQLVFSNNVGRPLDPSSLQKAFKYALLESKVDKPATPHTLRHSYATHLCEAGVNLRVIQTLMGHASLKTTAVYLHVARRLVVDTANCIDALL